MVPSVRASRVRGTSLGWRYFSTSKLLTVGFTGTGGIIMIWLPAGTTAESALTATVTLSAITVQPSGTPWRMRMLRSKTAMRVVSEVTVTVSGVTEATSVPAWLAQWPRW